jgi:hypothetical protein
MRPMPVPALALVVAVAACASPRPSEAPRDEPWLVLVKSARLPMAAPWVTRFAHHTWLDVKRGSEEEWWRAEVAASDSGVVFAPINPSLARDDTWYNRRALRLLATIEGEPARRIADALPELCRKLDERYADGYLRWPGPNSNTFVADLARELPDLAFTFDANAIGKDWPGWFDAGVTSSKSGLHLDTPVAGAALGLREGIELHVLGLTLAVRLWPPGLALPFLPEIPLGFGVEWRDSLPLPPERYEPRLDLPAGEAAVAEKTFDVTGWCDLVLVDAATGEWMELQWQPLPPDEDAAPTRYMGYAIVHGATEDETKLHLGPIERTATEPDRYEFGRCVAELRYAIVSDGAARIAVRLTRSGAR